MAEVGFGDSETTDNRIWNPKRPYQYLHPQWDVWVTDEDALAAYKTANPELFPASGLNGQQMSFGGSNVTSTESYSSPLTRRPADQTQTNAADLLQQSGTPTLPGGMLDLPPIVPDRPTTTVTPEEQAAAEQAAADAAQQEMLQNEAFLALLQQLGLTGLINAYGQSSGVDVSQYLQPTYQAPAYQMSNMYQPKGMMTGQTFGVAPYRTGYLPPLVVPPSTVASDTGLLQYVMNQG